MRQCLLFPQSWRDSHVYDENARIVPHDSAEMRRLVHDVHIRIIVLSRHFTPDEDVTTSGHRLKKYFRSKPRVDGPDFVHPHLSSLGLHCLRFPHHTTLLTASTR